MKKVFMATAIVLATAGAFLSESNSLAATAAPIKPITLYDPSTCNTFECTSPSLPITCTNLNVGTCTGSAYTGNLKRSL